VGRGFVQELQRQGDYRFTVVQGVIEVNCTAGNLMSNHQNTFTSLSSDNSTSGSSDVMSYAAVSWIGDVRGSNQDSLGLKFSTGELFIAAVADGMGGHAGGDVASSTAISMFIEETDTALDQKLPEYFQSLITRIAERLRKIQKASPQYSGMGTTLSTVAIDGSTVTIAHIGDSRIYRSRGGDLVQLSHDHSWVQQQIDAGLLDLDQAMMHPRRNLLTRTLSAEETDEIDIDNHTTEIGDRYLICSDGVHGVVADKEIAQSLLSASLDDCLNQLMNLVHKKGSPDNATAIVISIDEL
jgi:serine/threonine protein phosphatase PrpC